MDRLSTLKRSNATVGMSTDRGVNYANRRGAIVRGGYITLPANTTLSSLNTDESLSSSDDDSTDSTVIISSQSSTQTDPMYYRDFHAEMNVRRDISTTIVSLSKKNERLEAEIRALKRKCQDLSYSIVVGGTTIIDRIMGMLRKCSNAVFNPLHVDHFTVDAIFRIARTSTRGSFGPSTDKDFLNVCVRMATTINPEAVEFMVVNGLIDLSNKSHLDVIIRVFATAFTYSTIGADTPRKSRLLEYYGSILINDYPCEILHQRNEFMMYATTGTSGASVSDHCRNNIYAIYYMAKGEYNLIDNFSRKWIDGFRVGVSHYHYLAKLGCIDALYNVLKDKEYEEIYAITRVTSLVKKGGDVVVCAPIIAHLLVDYIANYSADSVSISTLKNAIDALLPYTDLSLPIYTANTPPRGNSSHGGTSVRRVIYGNVTDIFIKYDFKDTIIMKSFLNFPLPPPLSAN